MQATLGHLSIPALLVMGLALFLLGMSQLENGVRSLGYNTFKRWLSNSTKSSLGSIAVGASVTAILQSSSLVSLMVLAFASAAVLPLTNAVGMILGANLGTTFTGWMVATIGFKLSLQAFALPLMASGAILQLVSQSRARLRGFGVLLFGLGLIVFGLDIMKDAVGDLPSQWDLGALRAYGPWLYFLAGAAIAALIQSSSATMMITLAGLHAGLLNLESAAALVIGADLGTTSTTALGSIGGHFIKRQLALAHFLFNAIVDLGAFFLLLPLLPAMIELFSLQDPLYSLVAFHSLFNLLGLLAFLPILTPFSNWIGNRFISPEAAERPLVGQPVTVPDAALLVTGRVLANIRNHAAVLNLHAFHLSAEQLTLPAAHKQLLEACFDVRITPGERYRRIKQQESDLLAYSFDLQEQALNASQVALLQSQIRDARALVYSSKTLNDVRENLVSMRHSEQENVVDLYHLHRNFMTAFYGQYLQLPARDQLTPTEREIVMRLLEDNERHYQQSNDAVNQMASMDLVSGIELSTMLNVNREVHHALKSLLLALE